MPDAALLVLDYVRKDRSTEDRRKVLFSLTAEGRAAVTASHRHRRDWLNAHLAELEATELARLAAVLPVLLRIADS